MLETTSLPMLLSCFLGILKTSMASYQSISFPNQAPLKYRHFYLYSAVSPICYDNISIRIYSHSSWCIKLSVSFSIWSKLQYEFSLLVKYLYGLKQKPEYGIVSNISNLLHTHTHTHRDGGPQEPFCSLCIFQEELSADTALGVSPTETQLSRYTLLWLP